MPDHAIILPPATPRALHRRRQVVTLLFVLLALAYSIITPIFEVSDELSHYPVVYYIAQRGELPVQDVRNLRPWDWEGAQPPLYYVLSALLIAPLPQEDFAQFWQKNPHAKIGIGLARDNQNMALHDWRGEAFPWRGTPLNVHVLRFFSIALATWAVWMVFAVARLAVPERPAVALAALCLTAFNPMFIGISASVNNDNLVNALVPTGLAIALSIWRAGFSWQRVLAGALVGTLAAASKLSGMLVFAPIGFAIMLALWREKRPWRDLLLAGLLCVAVWLGLFGWWYARNQQLYGDPFGNQHMAETVGLRAEAVTVLDVLRDESNSFFVAYWGWLGGLTILAPENLFSYAKLLCVLGLLGLLGWLWRPAVGTGLAPYGADPSGGTPDRSSADALSPVPPLHRSIAPAWRRFIPLLLLLSVLLLGLYGVMSWTLITPASQGRLLFPFMAATSTLLGLGLVWLLGSRWGVLSTAPLLLYALMMGGVLIPAAFRLPPQVDSLPTELQQTEVRYGDIALLGYHVDSAAITAGESLKLTLYWQAARTLDPLSFYVQVYGPDDSFAPVEVGKIDSYPGRGLLRTDQWVEGAIYADTYYLELPGIEPEMLPFEPRFKIGWRDYATETEIPARTATGDPIAAVFVEGGALAAAEVPSLAGEGLANFGGVIQLNTVSVSTAAQELTLLVEWQPLSDLHEDFTVFVHLVEPGSRTPILASGDSPPRQGWWDSSAWIPGQPFTDRYTIPLDAVPAGEYELLLGFYRPADFTRLPLLAGAGDVDALRLPVRVE